MAKKKYVVIYLTKDSGKICISISMTKRDAKTYFNVFGDSCLLVGDSCLLVKVIKEKKNSQLSQKEGG